MAAFVSLFFDNAGVKIPQENLAQAKESIWKNYKRTFKKPNLEDTKSLQDILEDKIAQEMSQQLSEANTLAEADKKNPIAYWEIGVGQAIGTALNENFSQLERAKQVFDLVERYCNILSDSITAANGAIPEHIITSMKKSEESLRKVQQQFKNFNAQTSEKRFKGAVFGALRGAVAAAQGALHEAACIYAAQSAQELINKEFQEANTQLEIIVEATGGRFNWDSKLGKAVSDNKIETGLTNNPKNDITVALKDGNGKIVWSYGISLKSTTSKEPNLVKIMVQSLTTLLNKQYAESVYMNMAGALGKGDWSGYRVGIGAIAEEQNNIKTSSEQLAAGWKNMVYSAIYKQLIDMFSGSNSGGILNNAQYLIINAKPIAMYDIFQKLENINNPDSLFNIRGISIGGRDKAINARKQGVEFNIRNFIKDSDDNPYTTAQERLLRGSAASMHIYSYLQGVQIKISLKYNDLIGGSTR